MLALDSSGEKFDKRPFSDFVIGPDADQDCVSPDPEGKISTPHSNSFLDLNGDCMPDIFLQKSRRKDKGVEHYSEIYIQKQAGGQQKYCL